MEFSMVRKLIRAAALPLLALAATSGVVAVGAGVLSASPAMVEPVVHSVGSAQQPGSALPGLADPSNPSDPANPTDPSDPTTPTPNPTPTPGPGLPGPLGGLSF